jgi:RNA polymerase sigma-70 factor (ECF subfamily)
MGRWLEIAVVAHDENALVRLCLAENEEASARLVEAHARMVGTVILRATADAGAVEDLAQETFLRVFRALPWFDGRSRLSTWIYTIAHRVAIDHLRKAGRWREESLDAPEEAPGGPVLDRLSAPRADVPDAALERTEADRLVREGLARLPDKYRTALEYTAIDGLGYPEVAEMLGVPLGTVKTLVFRGKRMLRERIETAVTRAGAARRAAAAPEVGGAR